MLPALAKLVCPISLNPLSEDRTIIKLHEKLLSEFDEVLGRYRKGDYTELSVESRKAVAKYLKEWIEYDLAKGEVIPYLKESSGRLGFKLEEVLDILIANGSTRSDEFEAVILVTTEPITIVGQFGDRFTFAYGDISEDLINRRATRLYHLDCVRVSGFEEFQPIQL